MGNNRIVITNAHQIGAVNELIGRDRVVIKTNHLGCEDRIVLRKTKLICIGAAFIDERTVGRLIESAERTALVNQAAGLNNVKGAGRTQPSAAIEIPIVSVA